METRNGLLLLAAFMVSAPLFADSITVFAKNDISSAGQASPVSDGTLPPSFNFTAGAGQSIVFTSVTGAWYTTNVAPFGPDGVPPGEGNVPGPSCGVGSYCQNVDAIGNGISSYSTTDFEDALVGVFLTDATPSGGPAGLTFYDADSSQGGIQTNFTSLSPEIGQIFFIGDGLTGTGSGAEQIFNAPDTATRLFLGQADSCGFDGPPSCFFDNGGSVNATFTLEGSESPSSVPEPATLSLFAATAAASFAKRALRNVRERGLRK